MLEGYKEPWVALLVGINHVNIRISCESLHRVVFHIRCFIEGWLDQRIVGRKLNKLAKNYLCMEELEIAVLVAEGIGVAGAVACVSSKVTGLAPQAIFSPVPHIEPDLARIDHAWISLRSTVPKPSLHWLLFELLLELLTLELIPFPEVHVLYHLNLKD